ncbi:adenylate cyclase type 5-like isoform X2 [Homalodisca vitripennis]|uniref:adenylate cyclase type 5-like isoform X2 n=1 Tax=Homalodisca vitripennis TaxID=197043 RepID=UPI001EE9E5BB|nr:adenylate cyclase type 5-like isoform X2 [Homalodisca vitripennis]
MSSPGTGLYPDPVREPGGAGGRRRNNPFLSSHTSQCDRLHFFNTAGGLDIAASLFNCPLRSLSKSYTECTLAGCFVGLIRLDLKGMPMTLLSYLLILTFIPQEFVLSYTPSHLWVTVCYVYIINALLPIRLQEALITSIIITFMNYPIRYLNSKKSAEPVFQLKQEITNLLLISCVIIIGAMTHFTSDLAKRKAFTETRHFVAARIAIQHETRRQKKLVMSVLPEHLAEEMTADIAAVSGTVNEMQSLIYIKSYDPVSIIFADIRGFTAMADRSPAQRVVELLNELFCRFDRLAAKNRCLRIKLLGDCYHAVSGLPIPTPNHADYCVILGLEIIDTMHNVREKFASDVGIRVGIHSGQVNCGVLGLKKWQFDVWSKDVTLANYMESGGMDGLVHISEATKNYLSDPSCYICEPAYGGDREPALRSINTYFVTANTPEEGLENKPSIGLLTRNENEELFNLYHALGTANVLFSPMTAKEKSIEKEVMATMNSSINSRSIRRLKKINCKPIVLTFRNRHLEREYNNEPDQMLQIYFFTATLVYFIITIVQFILIPIDQMLIICSIVGFVWTTLATGLVTLSNCKESFPCRMIVCLSVNIYSDRRKAQLLAIITLMIIYVAIILPVLTLDCSENEYLRERAVHLVDPKIHKAFREKCPSWYMSYVEYTLLYTMMIMALTSAFQIITFTCKAFVMLFMLFCYILLFFTAPTFKKVWDAKSTDYYKYYLMLIVLISFMLLIVIHSQQSEIIQRLDFIWKRQANDEKEEVQKMQKINQKLIENILPAHVAKIYLEKDYQHSVSHHARLVI